MRLHENSCRYVARAAKISHTRLRCPYLLPNARLTRRLHTITDNMIAQHCYTCAQPVTAQARFCPHCGRRLLLHDRYRLLRLMGQGGFALVYEALDTLLGRTVAVKQVPSGSAAEQQQIAHEVDILSRFASRLAFIPDIYDLWSAGSATYLVMEYIAGPTLEDLLARRWTPAQTTRFLRSVLTHLGKLHGAGIIHRDLKPSNIKRPAPNRYVLLDFGIARHAATTQAFAHAVSLEYAPLEQLQGRPTDARSDLYSLAATAYRLLTGAAPVPVPARLATGAALPRPGALVANVPPALDCALMHMLALDADDRPPNAKAALQLLRTPPHSA